MTDDEFRDQILAEWDRWALANLNPEKKAIGNQTLGFFGHLRSHHRRLLEFGKDGECYQTIYGWLTTSGRVED